MALSIVSHLHQYLWQGFLRNVLFLTLPALLLLFLLLEIAVRVLFPVSDVPATYFHPQLGNHYVPNQTGRYVKGRLKGNKPEIAATYRINAAGWNSPHEYTVHKPDGQTRLAIIGDSYVEALQVACDSSFPYLLEERLQEQSPEFRVYSFGHSGANLVQYLNVLRYAVLPTQPDIVIVTLIRNDFSQALTGFSHPDNWSLHTTSSGLQEVPPIPSRFLPLKLLARRSALVRYLFVNLSFAQHLAQLKRSIVPHAFGAADSHRVGPPLQPKAVLLNDLVQYVCREFAQLAQRHQFRLVFLLAVNQRAAYHAQESNDPVAYHIHQTVQAVAAQSAIAVLDLADSFRQAWQQEKKRFDWHSDGHWNAYAHTIVANAVFEFLRAEDRYPSHHGGPASRPSSARRASCHSAGQPAGFTQISCSVPDTLRWNPADSSMARASSTH